MFSTLPQLFCAYLLFNQFSCIFRLLDDLGNDIEMTDSRLQTMLIRVEKVLKLADGKFI